jgi:hypothetical protein
MSWRSADDPKWRDPLHLIKTALRVMVVALAFAPVVAIAANEQRCNELGASCICSEPFNTNSYSSHSTHWQNPNDTTSSDKQCSTLGPSTPGAVIEIDGGLSNGLVFGANNGEIWSRLPSGHRLSWVARRQDGHNSTGIGLWPGPGTPAPGNGLKIRAMRWYQYFSSNAQFTREGSCLNTKLVEIHGGGSADSIFLVHIFGGMNTADAVFWNPKQDCCGSTWPDPISYNELRGNGSGAWWRFEMHAINPAGGPGTPIRLRLFAKNVTTNAPEKTLVDTSIAQAGWQPSANLTPGSTARPGASNFSAGWINAFRNGSCTGFEGWSHLMYAQWDTDQGQRIGPAAEIEGGGGGGGSVPALNAPPSSPTGLSIR